MRVGTLCYATDQGLGILAKGFIDHGIITHPLVINHSSHPCHGKEWYPAAPSTPIRSIDQNLLRDFCRSMNVMVFFETPFQWDLIYYCRQHGVRTVFVPMYECYIERFHPLTSPQCKCDLYICPSLLDLAYFAGIDGITFLPVPVETPWRQRERAEVFVHNAGHGGLRGRNGTRELIEAISYVESPVRFLIRSQEPGFKDSLYRAFNPTEEKTIGGDVIIASNARGQYLSYGGGTVPYSQLWQEGDVFVFPEKFNGLSLPLQEARAAGMLVMGCDRYPMNTWLPQESLIPVQGYQKARVGGPYLEFDEAVISPRVIAETIDKWWGRDISEYSLQGREWAMDNSWEVLGPKWKAAIEGLL